MGNRDNWPDELKALEKAFRECVEEMGKDINEDKNKEEEIRQESSDFTRVKVYRNQHIIDEIFTTFLKGHGFICGGFARYCCSPSIFPVLSDDIDIYCKSEYYFKQVRKFLNASNDFKRRKRTEASLNYYWSKHNVKFQLIKPIVRGNLVLSGEAEEILANFDFPIARVGIKNEIVAIADKKFLEQEISKKASIENIHCPLAEVYRVAKYVAKGYFFPVREIMKIFIDWDSRDVEYKTKLQDFLSKEDLSKEDIDELEKLLHID